MRTRTARWGLSAVLVAAGLALTACDPNGSITVSSSNAPGATAPTAGTDATPPTTGTSGSSGGGSSSGGTSGGSGSSDSGSGSASGSMCKTSNLTFSAEHGLSGEGQEIVNLTNSGSSTCTMHGFPGVDLKSEDGSDTISAGRSNSDIPTVRLAPGEQTDFVLNYPFNNSGGTGYTFTTMIVTPPNETHSKTLSVPINIPVENPDQPSEGPGIVVNAVGAGK